MNEDQIWQIIVEDRPREWMVFVDGSYFARETSTMARLHENVRDWIAEAMIWCMDYRSREARVLARCPLTDERIEGEIAVTVTPDMGESTMV